MKALRIHQPGPQASLNLEEVADPALAPDEILVRVHATGLNRADLLQLRGRYPAPPGVPADIPGLEYAGTVEQLGPRVTRFRPGDRVMGIVGGGAFAERLVTHEREAMAVPAQLSWAEAAAIPEAFVTAFDALVLQGGLRSGETVLIHAVASGVGTAATQVANALGATVLGTSRSRDKLERCAQYGLAEGIDCGADNPQFADRVKMLTGGRGADVVMDLVGGPYLPETLRCLASRGRILLVGLLAGSRAEVPLGELLARRANLTGTVLRSRPLEEKILLARAFERQLMPLFESGRLKPVVDTVFPLSEVAQALARLADNQSFGKLVLQWETP